MMARADTTQKGAIVVGVDGSGESQQALRWGVAEARLRDVPLRVAHAWTFGYGVGLTNTYAAMGATGVQAIEPSDLHRAAEHLLDRTITESGVDLDGLEVERVVAEGGPASVLLDLVTPPDLLVVGSRGHGGFTSLLLGSVSQQCAHHAPCPVVIVRSKQAHYE
jgi:nucleotide-binding universal stress UspA family protein